MDEERIAALEGDRIVSGSMDRTVKVRLARPECGRKIVKRVRGRFFLALPYLYVMTFAKSFAKSFVESFVKPFVK